MSPSDNDQGGTGGTGPNEEFERRKVTEAAISRQTALSAISVFFASLGIALLALARDTYASRIVQQHKRTDDVTTTFWLVSVFYAVIAAVLGRRGVTDIFANIIMDLSFVAMLVGGFVFIWAEHSGVVAISFTVAIGVVFVGFMAIAVATPNQYP